MGDRDDLSTVHRLTQDAMRVLTVQSSQGNYPYMMTDRKQLELGAKASMSTNSMVCHALAVVGGLLPETVVTVTRVQADAAPALEDQARFCLRNGINALIRSIVPDPQVGKAPAGVFNSPTFGKDDPFALTWLVELLRLASREPDIADSETASKALVEVERVARSRVIQALQKPSSAILEPIRNERSVVHPFPLVRIVQLAHLLGLADGPQLASASAWFFDQLHLQLSLRGIEHGGFDPAELVFSLEGLIETAPLRATRPLISSFATCIDSMRKLDPTFRAVTPFKATGSGAVHLFASVEVFASLIRIAHKRELLGDFEFFESLKPALHDYLQWLQATVVTGNAEKPPDSESDSYSDDTPLRYSGWQSEYAHIGDSSIHVWLTSQVILYLRSYEILLSGSIARAALATAGLMAEPWQSTILKNPLALRQQAKEDDPLQLGPESPYRVASRLNSLFINPRLENRSVDAAYSCLLYGPPGTGKTTLAREIAQQLGWPLLTITTSDFIVDGEAQVEARAKNIFETLSVQRDLVVFFDEIDRLVLDRNTSDYRSQGDMLQFMTPSMLTKINNLRRAEHVIFMVGTNYADRIDSAIKRAGRIDERLLVLPPDLSKRRQIIKQELERRGGGCVDESQMEGPAIAAAWQTIAEIKAAVHEASRTGRDLVDVISRTPPAISLESYLFRLRHVTEGNSSGIPSELLEEAFLLLYLLMEGKDGPVPVQYDSLGDRWPTRPPGTIRDRAVEEVLNQIFSRNS